MAGRGAESRQCGGASETGYNPPHVLSSPIRWKKVESDAGLGVLHWGPPPHLGCPGEGCLLLTTPFSRPLDARHVSQALLSVCLSPSDSQLLWTRLRKGSPLWGSLKF